MEQSGQERNYMKDKAFLDSNVLVYFFDERDIRKQNIAMKLINSLTKTRTGQMVDGIKIINPFKETV